MSHELNEEQRRTLLEKIHDFNDQLVTYSINISGQAFGNALKLGCGLAAVPLLIILGITLIRRTFDLSTLFVYSCAALLFAIGFASLISTRAKQIAFRDGYKQDINPDIVKFLGANQFTRAQFDSLANEVLEMDAPLREYLVVPQPESEENQDD